MSAKLYASGDICRQQPLVEGPLAQPVERCSVIIARYKIRADSIRHTGLNVIRPSGQHISGSPRTIQKHDQLVQDIASQQHVLALFITNNLDAGQELPFDLQIYQGDGHRAPSTPMSAQVTAEDLLRSNRGEKRLGRNGHVGA